MQICSEAVLPAGRAVRALENLFAELDERGALPGISELTRLLRENPVALEGLESVLRFDAAGYTRTRLFESEFCEVLLLGWLPGQTSKIHDHGGSWGAVRVIAGEVSETRFEADAGGRARACETQRLSAGTVTEEQPTDIHRLANASRATPLVTLHVYAPPLRQVRTYAEA